MSINNGSQVAANTNTLKSVLTQNERQKLQRASCSMRSLPLICIQLVISHLCASVTRNAETQAQIIDVVSKSTIILSVYQLQIVCTIISPVKRRAQNGDIINWLSASSSVKPCQTFSARSYILSTA